MRHGIVVIILIGVLTAAAACDQRPTPTAPPPTTSTTPQSDPEPTSLPIGGPDRLMVGATAQYPATINYSDGAEKPGEGVERVSKGDPMPKRPPIVDASTVLATKGARRWPRLTLSRGPDGQAITSWILTSR